METIEFKVIGTITSKYYNSYDTPAQGNYKAHDEVSLLTIEEEYIEGIKNIETGEIITLIFVFDRNLRKFDNCTLTIIPRNGKIPKGIFSTRSPKRPNPIGVTDVKVKNKNDNIIEFWGGDMLNGTKVLDIKPTLKGE